MEYVRANKGTCAKSTRVVVEEGLIKEVEIMGGCPGNIVGLTELIKGMTATEAIERMKGITCGARPTSCPDQLALALEEAIN